MANIPEKRPTPPPTQVNEYPPSPVFIIVFFVLMLSFLVALLVTGVFYA